MKFSSGRLFIAFLVVFGLAWSAAAQDSEFGYFCATCPASWGSLSGDFEECSVGESQTPIAISTTQAVKRRLPRLRTHYDITDLEVEKLSTNFESFGEGSVRVGRKEFEFLQFHFHSKSEHFIDGEQRALELHLVHKSAAGELLVLGRFIKQGRPNAELEKLLEALPELELSDEAFVPDFDLNALVGRNRRSYRYVGSTTTPPCSPDVQWIMLASPLSLANDQIAKIRETILGLNGDFDNFRPLASRNGRKVFTDVRRRSSDDDDSSDDGSS